MYHFHFQTNRNAEAKGKKWKNECVKKISEKKKGKRTIWGGRGEAKNMKKKVGIDWFALKCMKPIQWGHFMVVDTLPITIAC